MSLLKKKYPNWARLATQGHRVEAQQLTAEPTVVVVFRSFTGSHAAFYALVSLVALPVCGTEASLENTFPCPAPGTQNLGLPDLIEG